MNNSVVKAGEAASGSLVFLYNEHLLNSRLKQSLQHNLHRYKLCNKFQEVIDLTLLGLLKFSFYFFIKANEYLKFNFTLKVLS